MTTGEDSEPYTGGEILPETVNSGIFMGLLKTGLENAHSILARNRDYRARTTITTLDGEQRELAPGRFEITTNEEGEHSLHVFKSVRNRNRAIAAGAIGVGVAISVVAIRSAAKSIHAKKVR